MWKKGHKHGMRQGKKEPYGNGLELRGTSADLLFLKYTYVCIYAHRCVLGMQ